ncbi:uncharacterized protein CIMG_13281 [Coccidioides immitis RS]|uniref:Uncharacterized protein n=1 Tax=Coccidioides immitis (strain RS) TaxID=246410 RepID=A0A0D8JUP1_COCIM|nr:uncharacterized protein CIMG_13281 [Coccidioides immitis RS]KJF60859.1 hypothetical protein CIMG_13281 [Coccidioides immitis RS]
MSPSVPELDKDDAKEAAWEEDGVALRPSLSQHLTCVGLIIKADPLAAGIIEKYMLGEPVQYKRWYYRRVINCGAMDTDWMGAGNLTRPQYRNSSSLENLYGRNIFPSMLLCCVLLRCLSVLPILPVSVFTSPGQT